jgi:integrase/recombinase XerD
MSRSRAPKHWSGQEVTTILTLARKENTEAYVFLLLSIFHGLRVSEAVNIRRHDFSGSPMKLRVKRLKGSEATEQVLEPHPNPVLDERAAVADFIRDLRPTEFLFTRDGQPLSRWQAYTMVQKFCRLAGIDESRSHPHAAKHSLGCLMYQAGQPIRAIQVALGHKNLNNTAIYTYVSEDEADVARAAAFGGL